MLRNYPLSIGMVVVVVAVIVAGVVVAGKEGGISGSPSPATGYSNLVNAASAPTPNSSQ